MTIISSIIGVIIGAYLNNFFTWKIKNTVDTLDLMYKNIAQLKEKLLLDVQENNKSNTIKLQLINYQSILDDLVMQNNILDNKFFNEVEAITYILQHPIEQLEQFTQREQLTTIINTINRFLWKIVNYRKELTSFCYMLKQVFPVCVKICTKPDAEKIVT